MQDRQDVYKDDNKLDFFMASASVDAGTHRHTNLVRVCTRQVQHGVAGGLIDRHAPCNMRSTYGMSTCLPVVQVKACRRRSAFLAKAAGAGLDKRTYTAMASTWTRAAAVSTKDFKFCTHKAF